jgi:hypothetical protein
MQRIIEMLAEMNANMETNQAKLETEKRRPRAHARHAGQDRHL